MKCNLCRELGTVVRAEQVPEGIRIALCACGCSAGSKKDSLILYFVLPGDDWPEADLEIAIAGMRRAEQRMKDNLDRHMLYGENPTREVTCRTCGASGSELDEFTSPHTGLCRKCTWLKVKGK